MSYTKEQEQIVLKTLSYKNHQYYEILEVSKTASDSDIKKSYRKLAIKLHPDKNNHPRASEAFKIVNKAWSVLGDEKKKTIFDQTGSDPDSRIPAGFSSGTDAFTGRRTAAGGTDMFEDDIFNMFFGGGRGASSTTYNFGNGFTFQSFGGGDPFFGPQGFGGRPQTRTRQQRPRTQQQEPSAYDTLKQLLPILLFLLVPILSSFFSESNNVPEYSFRETRHYNTKRFTPRHNIPFFVNEKTVSEKLTDKQLKNFEHKVENVFIQDKRSKCSKEQIMKNDLMEDAQGWFSVDQVKLQQAENMPMPNCQVLRDLNLI